MAPPAWSSAVAENESQHHGSGNEGQTFQKKKPKENEGENKRSLEQAPAKPEVAAVIGEGVGEETKADDDYQRQGEEANVTHATVNNQAVAQPSGMATNPVSARGKGQVCASQRRGFSGAVDTSGKVTISHASRLARRARARRLLRSCPDL